MINKIIYIVMEVPTLPAEIWTIIIKYAYNPQQHGWHRYLCQLSLLSHNHFVAVQNLLIPFLKNPVMRARQNDCLMNKTVLNRMLQNSAVMETGFIYRERKYKKEYPGKIKFSFQNKINDQKYCPVKYSQNKYWIAKNYTNVLLVPIYKPKKFNILAVDIPIIAIPFICQNTIYGNYHGVYIIDTFELCVYYNFSGARRLYDNRCQLRDRHEIMRRIYVNILNKDIKIPVNFDEFIDAANIRDIIENIHEIITYSF